jgi:hypothetical protein
MKCFYPFLFLFLSFYLNGQIGPAGLCDLDDEDLLFWFNPEYGIEDSSAIISSWRSRATHLMDASDSLSGILLKQMNVDKRPVLASSLKGRSSFIELDGINDFLETANFSDVYEGDQSILVVFKYAELDTSHSAIFAGHESSSSYSWQLAYKGGSVRVYNGFSGSTNLRIESDPDGAWHLYYIEVEDDQVSVYLDGAFVDNVSPIVDEVKRLYNLKLGQNRQSNIYAEGCLGDVLAFGRVLTEFERLRLFNTFSARYDIPLAYQDYFDEGLFSEFGLNVIGVGMHNEDAYMSVKGENGISVSLSSGLENGEMLFVGQSNLSTGSTLDNKPNEWSERLVPTFAVDEDGHLGDVNFSIDSSVVGNLGIGEMKLVVSTDTIFSDSDSIYDMVLQDGVYSSDIDFVANAVSYVAIGAVYAPLNISFLNFTADRDPSKALNTLSYTLTTSGVPFDVVIEKSSDSRNWYKIFEEKVNCIDACSYVFEDPMGAKENLYYRIKSESQSGRIQYSKVLKVVNKKERLQSIFYPNPSSGKLNFYDKKSGDLKIMTPDGKLVFCKQLLNDKQVDLRELGAGLYFIQLESVDDQVIHQRLLLQD